MTIKTITSFKTLMLYAKELGKARASGDSERIEKAKKLHDEYRDMCLKSDMMLLSCRVRDL